MGGTLMTVLSISIILLYRTDPIAACYQRTHEVNCRSENLKQVPVEYLEDKLCKRLNLGLNLIDNLEDTNLKSLKYKRYIDDVLLDNNLIQNLSSHFFGQLPHVKLLDLSRNRIRNVGEQLCSMYGLQELILNENPIEYIHEGAFSCLLYLLSIRLANTAIKMLYINVFNVRSLIYLNLEGTHIENINEVYISKEVIVVAPTYEPPPSVITKHPMDYGSNYETDNTALYTGVGCGVMLAILAALGSIYVYKKFCFTENLKITSHEIPFYS